MNNITQRLITLFFLVAFCAISIGGIRWIWPKYRQTRDLETEKNRILAEIEQKRAQIKELKAKQQRFKSDPEFIEMYARKKFNRVFPGELVFVFED